MSFTIFIICSTNFFLTSILCLPFNNFVYIIYNSKKSVKRKLDCANRCQIDEYNSSQKLGKIVISCDCEPFKYKQNITTFNLVEGTNTVNNSRMTVYADLINESEVTINNKTYNAGTHLRTIKLTSGANTLNSSGNATLNFQEGEI